MRKFLWGMLLFIVTAVNEGYACSTDMIHCYILYGQNGGILDTKLKYFFDQQNMNESGEQQPDAIPHLANTIDADIRDLRAAIVASVSDPTQCESIATQYSSLRSSIRSGTSLQFMPASGDQKEADLSPYSTILPLIPEEFVIYLKGAVAYHVQSFDQAKTQWTRLLSLPPEQRKNRSTWAAFMLGKTCLVTDVTSAPSYFMQTRELAEHGFKDSLDLAWESLGWQGMAEMKTGHFKEALQCYHLQLQKETDSYEAVNSLTECCRGLDSQKQIDPEIMKDPALRKIVLKFLQTQDHCYNPQRYSNAVRKAEIQIDKEDADYLVWISYTGGDYRTAWEWIAVAKELGPKGKWIQSKLLLREGKIKEGLDLLREIAASFPEDYQPMVYAETGLLHLGRKEYIEALDTFLRGDLWTDAAYIAERVLTISELENYIHNRKEESYAKELHSLLARRYARAKQWNKAVKIDPFYEDLISYVQKAGNQKLSKEERAKCLFWAGVLMHRYGMTYTGTEVDPDCAMIKGLLYCAITDKRIQGANKERIKNVSENFWEVLSPSEDEKKRIAQTIPAPNKRFHYRYIAADYLWQAAALLPDNNERTARMLYEAGSFLKDRDPEAADKFYKALVRRCGKLPIGKAADKKKWFPESFEMIEATGNIGKTND